MKADRLESVPANTKKMQPIVIKRDGCQVPFDEVLIKQAVQRAAIAAGIDSADIAGRLRALSLKICKTRHASISTKFRMRLKTS